MLYLAFLIFSFIECNEHHDPLDHDTTTEVLEIDVSSRKENEEVIFREPLLLDNYIMNNYAHKWLPKIMPLMDDTMDFFCKQDLIYFNQVQWKGLNGVKQENILLCFKGYYLSAQNVNSNKKPLSPCDELLNRSLTFTSTNIRYELTNCIEKRLFIDYIKYYTGWDKLPYNLFDSSEDYMTFIYNYNAGITYSIIYMTDQTWDETTVLSQKYKSFAMDLVNTTHYDKIINSESLKEHREKYVLEDYCRWNNATLLETQIAHLIYPSLIELVNPLLAILWHIV